MPTSPADRPAGARYDVAVVGAGPAGLAAAAAAGDGVQVALVDAGDLPGGQFWRRPADPARARQLEHLHHRLAEYRALCRELDRGGVDKLPGHQVWAVEARKDAGFVLHAVVRDPEDGQERERVLTADRLVLAPGAYDRQVPFPGWTLPGVLTAGGAQALLKGHGVRAGERVVVAGTGPFLLPVATGLAAAGAQVVGVHEAGSPRAWLPHTGAVLRNPGRVGEAVGYAATLARHRVPVHTGSVLVAAHGTDRVEAVTVVRGGAERRIECDALAVGWGFTPQLELPLALGCATRIDVDGSAVCVVGDDQASSVPGVYVAGEACGIGGAALAVVEGRIAGSAAAGRSRSDRVGVRLRRRRATLRRFAAAMHTAHPVATPRKRAPLAFPRGPRQDLPGWIDRLTPDTIVCRCEEVTAARLRAVVDGGATDARSAKLLARPGMGWCQGRVCGYATACLTAAWTGSDYRPELAATRPIAAPVRLGTLADPDGG